MLNIVGDDTTEMPGYDDPQIAHQLGEILNRNVEDGQQSGHDENAWKQRKDEIEGHGGGRIRTLVLVSRSDGLAQNAAPRGPHG